MGGKITRLEKIMRAIKIIKQVDKEYKYDMESMIYAFASKFLNENELRKVKEEIAMTELGKMLIEDGIEKGKATLLIKLLEKKFEKIPNEYAKKIEMLPDKTIEAIGMDIFDINSVTELEKYFK